MIASLSAEQSNLRSLQLYFADEEGDPFAVELAARFGAYIVAQDSDYVILNAEGYQGYIPIHDMVWSGIPSDRGETLGIEAEDGFQTVVKSKSRKKLPDPQSTDITYGLVPPENVGDLQLSVLVYSPTLLASYLQIPESLLPLLAALVGNDFTGNKDTSITTQQINLQWLFFDRKLTLSQRVNRVAQTLRSILSAALAPGAKGKPKLQVGSVMELIEKATVALTIRPTDHLASGVRAKVIETVVEATLRYAIPRREECLPSFAQPWMSEMCPLHEESSCPLVGYFTPPESSHLSLTTSEILHQSQSRVRILYISAYRAGKLDSRLLDVLNTGTFWSTPFLENPDLETVSRSISRPINQLCYSLFDHGVGLLEPEDGSEESTDESGGDDDELVDVVEESDEEDPLAPLRGALQKLDHPGDDTESHSTSDSQDTAILPITPKVVVEWVRRGTRIAPEEVTVPPLTDVLNSTGIELKSGELLQLAPEEVRFTFLLRYLHSDTPKIRALAEEHILVALTLRWVLSRLNARAQESNGNKDRLKELWSRQEVHAFLATFSGPLDEVDAADDPPLLDRNVQLVSQFSAALRSVERLAETLLLHDRVPHTIDKFSGRLFHSYLTGTRQVPSGAMPTGLWDACVENLESALAVTHKERRQKKQTNQTTTVRGSDRVMSATNGRKQKGGYGKFDLLASLGG